MQVRSAGSPTGRTRPVASSHRSDIVHAIQRAIMPDVVPASPFRFDRLKRSTFITLHAILMHRKQLTMNYALCVCKMQMRLASTGRSYAKPRAQSRPASSPASPFRLDRLKRSTFITLHAILMHRKLLTMSCRFVRAVRYVRLGPMEIVYEAPHA